jgi:hypothetical protein
VAPDKFQLKTRQKHWWTDAMFILRYERPAFCTPSTSRERKVCAFFRNAYEARSKIAHGSSPDKKKLLAIDGSACTSEQGFADALGDVLRAALKKAIARAAANGSFMSDDDWTALMARDDPSS